MKLVSLKNLLVSLLGVGFILYKIMTFDDLSDLFWIVLYCYLTSKCLMASFSQKAFDKDLNEASQKQALYRDLFGRFGYIAIDVPFILFFLTGFLAILCPVSKRLSVVICILLLLSLGYLFWFMWYVGKHKRLRKERGQWGTAVLSAEEERAWKRSEIWHLTVYGVIVAVLGILYLYA